MSAKLPLSLLVPYRNRLDHLQSFVNWYANNPPIQGCAEIILLEADKRPTAAQEIARHAGLGYRFVECYGVFHKTRALNAGLAQARGNLIAPFDIDLIPVNNALTRQFETALASPAILLTGYRLLSRRSQIEVEEIETVAAKGSIAAEDGKSALRKYLLTRQRFGHVPMFSAESLKQIGGWSESFIGWGAEDQELIERYLAATGKVFVRSPDFVYLHLYHRPARLWNEPGLVAKNRDRHRLLMLRAERNGPKTR
jgi:N-terminal domain of galactosyltransferase